MVKRINKKFFDGLKLYRIEYITSVRAEHSDESKETPQAKQIRYLYCLATDEDMARDHAKCLDDYRFISNLEEVELEANEFDLGYRVKIMVEQE